MGFDPAYRTGCKIAVVDATGKVLETAVVYPTPPQSKTGEAEEGRSAGLIRRYGVDGHLPSATGPASKESEIFVAELLGELNPTLTNKVSYMVVSEAGASVYSASKLGAEEFPQFDVSLRSAVSIARRLQDPLAELVKIDPKAIGVGQYQHDMPPKQLDEALGGVVEDCVNRVGVDLNTASGSLLSYVAGVNQAVAKNIVAYREENGSFVSRSQLMKVPKLGKKAYEQCAGFLRVPESGNPLDHTGVHPESYAAAQKLLTLCGYRLEEVLSDEIAALPKRVAALGSTAEVAARIGVGEPTLRDMVAELVKAGARPARRAAKAAAAHRCDGAFRPKARHGADRNGAQRHRLRRLCGHRGPRGRIGAHLADLQPLYPPPLRGAEGGGHRAGEGAGCGPQAKTNLADHEGPGWRGKTMMQGKGESVCPGNGFQSGH